MAEIERGFVRIREGQVHYRRAGDSRPGATPLWMIHASPASSVTLLRLMGALADSRAVIAPDTLGNGDSCPPAESSPEITYYANAALRTMDALGIERVDLYGSHTGAHIAVEIAIARPDRVRRLVIDGIGMFDPETRRDLLANYAPAVEPDIIGSQFNWAWHFIRDQALHFPYFHRDPAHRRTIPMSSPDTLHRLTVEVLKSVRTYHLAYRAAFRHASADRLPLLAVPTLVTIDETDPMIDGFEPTVKAVPNAKSRVVRGEGTPEGLAEKATMISEFLSG